MKKIICCFVLVVMCVTSLSSVQAKGGEGITTVSYMVSSDSLYNCEIVVSKNGSVYDGIEHFREGSRIYNLKVSERKKFSVIPDKGYKIKAIYYSEQGSIEKNGIDLHSKLNNNVFLISGIAGNTRAEIIFEKDENNQNIVNTMDTGNQSVWLLLLLISGMVVVTYTKRKHFNKLIDKASIESVV